MALVKNPRKKVNPTKGFGLYKQDGKWTISPMDTNDEGLRPAEFHGFTVVNWSPNKDQLQVIQDRLSGN